MILKIIHVGNFFDRKKKLENWKTKADRIHTGKQVLIFFKVDHFSYVGFTIDFISCIQK